MKKLALAAAVAVLATGCATQTYTLSNQSQAEPSYKKNQPFFVNGIGQEQEVNAAEVCNNVAKVQTKMTFLNGLLGTVSYGIYTPRQIKVFCK